MTRSGACAVFRAGCLAAGAMASLLVPGRLRAALDPPAPPEGYDLVDLGPGVAYDINGHGWVVGATDYGYGPAFVWDGATMTELLPPGAGSAAARAVNDAGVVAVHATYDDEPWGRAFTWTELGGFVELERIEKQSWADVSGINDFGEVVGRVEDEFGHAHATLWVNGARNDLSGLEIPDQSEAFEINSSGQVVGYAATDLARACFFDGAPVYFGATDRSSAYALNDLGDVAGVTFAGGSGGGNTVWAWIDGSFVTVTNGNSAYPHDINERRQVVGTTMGTAFLWQDGVQYDLGTMVAGGSDLYEAHAISDCGVIVGGTLSVRAVMLVPTPHDATDTDGDGLADVWELCGIDADEDGLVDLRLPGADPEHKDLYVELDAMVGHAPSAGALAGIVAAFAAAPVTSPDGVGGIALHFTGHVDPDDPQAACDPCVDEDDIPAAAWLTENGEFTLLKAQRFRSVAEQNHPRAAAILQAKNLAFRYGVSAQSFVAGDGSATHSGTAEIAGNDFYVTVSAAIGGAQVTDEMMSGTLMHEIGHTLGLLHGGDQDGPPFTYKPNYHSVMNYLWQMPAPQHAAGPQTTADKALAGLRGSWSLRFSDGSLNDLDENALDEGAGLGGDAGKFTLVGTINNGTGGPALTPMGGPVDWSRDGDVDDVGVAEDVNYLLGISTAVARTDVLTDPDDWALVQYLPSTADWQDKNGAWVSGVAAFNTGSGELSAEMIQALASLHFDCDGNGIDDDLEIDLGLVVDVDDNGIPDACQQLTSSAAPEPTRAIAVLQVGPPAPNPTSAGSIIEYALADAGHVMVGVFDLRGHRVRVLWDGERPAGRHRAQWDGRDENGRPSSSGTYLLRVESSGVVASSSVVLRR